jgi:hypothetical protein
LLFFNIRSAMVNKPSDLAKRQARDHYERFAYPSGHTALPPAHHQKMRSSSYRHHRCHTPPPFSSDD